MITLTCMCGKVFQLIDDAVGTTFACPLCHRELTVTPADTGKPVKAPPPLAIPDGSIACPTCAAVIPAQSRICPQCNQSLFPTLTPDEFQAVITERLAEIDRHLSNSESAEEDLRLKGGALSIKSIVILAFFVLGLVMTIMGSNMSSNGETCLGLGIVTLVIFFIPVIVTMINDRKANHIQDADSPDIALRNFLTAVKTGRSRKAYVSLIPSARVAGPVETIKFPSNKIPSYVGRYAINDPASFKVYWSTIFTGPSGQTRTVTIKSVRKLRSGPNGLVLVEATLTVNNYASWIIALVLINLLAMLIVMLATRVTETRTVRKLLVERDGKWFIVDGSLEGLLDKSANFA